MFSYYTIVQITTYESSLLFKLKFWHTATKGEFLWVVVILVVLTVVELGLLLSLLFYFSLVVTTMVISAPQIFGNKQKSALANKIARADFY